MHSYVSCAIRTGVRIKTVTTYINFYCCNNTHFYGTLIFCIGYIKKAVFKIRVQHLGRISTDFVSPSGNEGREKRSGIFGNL